jgi:hypothetical protein
VFHLGRLLPYPLTILERLARDKHSSFLRKFITHGRKKFYNISRRSQLISANIRLALKRRVGNKQPSLFAAASVTNIAIFFVADASAKRTVFRSSLIFA